MKRDNYIITIDGHFFTTTHAWNSACRKIESHVRDTARNQGQTYRLTAKTTMKADFSCVSGERVWTGDKDGTVLTFNIQKEGV